MFYSRIPAFATVNGPSRGALDGCTIFILATSLFSVLLAVLPRMCLLLLHCLRLRTYVTMCDNHNDAPQPRLQERSPVRDLREPRMASDNLWQSVNSLAASDQPLHRLPHELQLSSLRTQPSFSLTFEHQMLPNVPLHTDRVPRQSSLSASIDDLAFSAEIDRGSDLNFTSTRTSRRIDASIVPLQFWSTTVTRPTKMASQNVSPLLLLQSPIFVSHLYWH